MAFLFWHIYMIEYAMLVVYDFIGVKSMPYFYAALPVILVLLIIFILLEKYRMKKRRTFFREFDWSQEESRRSFADISEIRRYWDAKNQSEHLAYGIDDTTWNDLDMDRVFYRMNATQSSVGEEYLYAALRNVNFAERELEIFDQATDYFSDHVETQVSAMCLLDELGRNIFNNVHSHLYAMDMQPLGDMKVYYLLVCVPLLCLSLCFFSIPVGIIFAVIAFCFNILFYYLNKFKIDANLGTVSYIAKMIYCTGKLSELAYGELAFDKQLSEAVKPLRKFKRLGNSLVKRATADWDVLLEYVRIGFMWDFITYDRMTKVLLRNQQSFQQVYSLIGQIDSAIAVGLFRKSLEYSCKPQFGRSDELDFEQVYHPLLNHPVSNSFTWKNRAILTGSNASGKSTFIKSLAISMICAQSIHLCFARAYTAPKAIIITAMAVRDKIYEGESYFIAEIKSLKRIFDALCEEIRTVCFIDEILKGTNTIERISASTAILSWLAGRNCSVIVASHDIELTELLSEYYVNYHFEETVTNEGVDFDYKIHTGFARSRNAINLLKLMGFDKQITEQADQFATHFEKTRQWENNEQKQ